MEEANRGDDVIWLPPGFRFHPTDEELVTSYLTVKVKNRTFSPCAIAEADLNKCEPWDLPRKAKMGENEWYFFCQRDRKYPTGMRTNRATEAGYWKATGKDKEIFRGKDTLVGMKKTLVFYTGRAPKGTKTNWVMHEYRLEGKLNYYTLSKSACDEWVVCRVFHKNPSSKSSLNNDLAENDEEIFNHSSPPPLMDPCFSKSTAESYFSRRSGQLEEAQYFNSYLSSTVQPYLHAHYETSTSTKDKQCFKEEQLSPDCSITFFSSTKDPFGNNEFEGIDRCLSDLDYFINNYS